MSDGGPPNIVLVQADQLAASAVGAYGSRVALTPHMDGLARGGAVFERAYCNSPLCVPSRASMMTGELPSTIGVYDNAGELPASTPTFAHHLRARGYHTALAGRMHFIGPDQLHGFEERLTTDVYPSGFDMVPDWDLRDDERLPWYHDTGSVFGAGPVVATLQGDYDDEVEFRALRHLTHRARAAVREETPPFLLVVSFIGPHDPYEPPAEHWERFVGREIPVPTVGPPPERALDPHSRRLRAMCGLDRHPPPPDVVERARRAYHASVAQIDDRVGRILRRLDALGMRDDTVVMITSDHGEMLGERGLWYKMSPFEDSLRVPLIVNAPGRIVPARIGHVVSLVDLLPTLAHVADGGLSRPAGDGAGALAGAGAGRSLVPLLRGERRDDRGRAVAEYLAEGVRAPLVTVVDGPHKLVRCPGDPDLLFDLDADPHELVNLAADPRHADLRGRLAALLPGDGDLRALGERIRRSQRSRRLVRAALQRGRAAAWDHEPPGQEDAGYVRGDFWTAIEGGRVPVRGLTAAADRELRGVGEDAATSPPATRNPR